MKIYIATFCLAAVCLAFAEPVLGGTHTVNLNTPTRDSRLPTLPQPALDHTQIAGVESHTALNPAKAEESKKSDLDEFASKLSYAGELILSVHALVKTLDGFVDCLAVSGPLGARMTLDIPEEGVGLGMKISVPLD